MPLLQETDPTKMSRIELLRAGLAKPGPFAAGSGMSLSTSKLRAPSPNSPNTGKRVAFAEDHIDID